MASSGSKGSTFRESFVGDGVTVKFPCTVALSAGGLDSTLVFVRGLLIESSGGTSYTILPVGPNGEAVLLFVVAPAPGATIEILAIG